MTEIEQVTQTSPAELVTPRRRPSSPQQVAEWRRLIEEEGWTLKATAEQFHVQARTVRLALGRDEARLNFRAAQRERLRGAIGAHDRDLLAESDRLRHALAWPPLSIVPAESLARKRHAALVTHLKRVDLPASVSRWEALVRRYDRAVAKLDHRLHNIDWAGHVLGEGAALRLSVTAEGLAKGSPPPLPGYLVQGRFLRDGPYEILGDVDSLDDPRAKRACADIEAMAQRLGTWEEVTELRGLHHEWARLQEKLVGAMEDLTLRQLPPGTCNWCPGESRAGG